MPTPRPETSVTWRAVEKPGARISEKISASESRARRVDQPLLDRAGAHRLRVQAAPVVADPDQHMGAGMLGRKLNSWPGRLCRPRGGPRGVSMP